ncbi:aldehyde dehydrogenase family protein [Pigmentiphaga sp. H8]|uniref:aldehyde dehydrogenase family protein n=1 Tax=Pigmentiphaga sp. H8 TaxID=2488560 RepID=UPI000F591C14|nr:aldehyde dehydrogenase family protein [Pigmentiphaga sp. H8]AZG08227.1 aldehyde dehydrogenase family protein [Pigmentiphaga sp. H8]
MSKNNELSAAPLRETPFVGRMWIGGEPAESSAGWLDCVNPADEGLIGRVPRGTAEDVDRAVGAALAAQEAWADLAVADRASHVRKLADALAGRADELLRLEVADSGNSITGMNGDVAACIDRLRYFAGLGYELQGSTIPGSSDRLSLTTREPYGVVGRIAAFNHPLAMAINGLASPLIAGNAVVVKPSEQCPLSATLLGEIASQILPPGIVNVVTGDGQVGGALVRHPRVKRLSFVGSEATGRAIQRSAAEVAVKSVSLELGGKNPFIVFPDAPLDKVAEAAVLGMNFVWQGQSCSSTSRLFVHDSIYDEVVKRVAAKAASIRLGDPFSWDTQMGAIISKTQLDKVESYVASAHAEGARLVTGGRRPTGPAFERGFWYEPTVFADVTQDMRIAREEIFGPVLSILRWSDVDDVLGMANAVDLGLTGAIWTRDISTALKTARRLQTGFVWINGVASNPRAVPFGGYKNSGVGRERGLEELYSYTEEKSVQIFL